MALMDLTGTEWTFYNTINLSSLGEGYNINFKSSAFEYVAICNLENSELCYATDQSVSHVYNQNSGWKTEYKTITITGGADTTNSNLISWLKANATWTNQPEGVSISYSGSEITTMEESGIRTLLTSGKYCESDITIVYTALEDGDNLSYGSNTSNYVNAGAADYMII